jgi:hypothetical protein
MSLQFQSPTADRRIEALAALWERAKSAAAHPPGCACSGGMMVTLDPRIIEDDILDYLHARYQDAQQPRLLAIVEGRRAQLMSPAGHERFEDWLTRAAHLSPDERDRLFGDLQGILESFGELDRSGFACY